MAGDDETIAALSYSVPGDLLFGERQLTQPLTLQVPPRAGQCPQGPMPSEFSRHHFNVGGAATHPVTGEETRAEAQVRCPGLYSPRGQTECDSFPNASEELQTLETNGPCLNQMSWGHLGDLQRPSLSC